MRTCSEIIDTASCLIDKNIPYIINDINTDILADGGKMYVVGGAVRDAIFFTLNTAFSKFEPKDFDIEVYGLSLASLTKILEKYGNPKVVGKAFGIMKITMDGVDFDFSLPRRDSKKGVGHKGIEVIIDENMTIEEGARRRDLTMNSVSYDLNECKILDPFQGIADIISHTAKMTSEAFGEDALRVLRTMQFAARFDLEVDENTIIKSQEIKGEYGTLSKERIREEREKMLLKGKVPSRGLEFLRKSGWVELYPELAALIDCPQNPERHPEGSVWKHTLHAVDAMVQYCEKNGILGMDRLVRLLGILCHDLGKSLTTKEEDGKIVSPGHAESGKELTRSFLNRILFGIKNKDKLIAKIAELAEFHMVHVQSEITSKFVRKMASKLKYNTFEEVFDIVRVDHNSRPNTDSLYNYKDSEKIVYTMELPDSANNFLDILSKQNPSPKKIINNSDLIDLGITNKDILKPKILELVEGKVINATIPIVFNELENKWIRDGGFDNKQDYLDFTRSTFFVSFLKGEDLDNLRIPISDRKSLLKRLRENVGIGEISGNESAINFVKSLYNML